MKYPENERILIVRPCLKYICLGNKPASKLLSLLLYYARNCDENEAEYTFMTTQEELIEDLIDEMDVKTLHRSAIPMLRLLGFLDVDGSSYRYKYTVHLNLISYLLANYKDNKREIASVLLSEMKEQLDKLPIEQKDTYPLVHVRRQLDNCLIQIDNLPIQLEKCPIQIDICLIPFRQMSNSKRGRKPSPEGHLEGISEDRRLDRDITDNKEKKREREVATATARSQSSSQEISQDDETVKREAVKPSQKDVAQNGHAHQHPVVDNHSPVGIHQPEPSQPEPRKDTNKVGRPPAPSKAHVNTSPFPVPKRVKPQSNIMDTLPSEEAVRIMNDWDSIFSRPCTRTENHIKAAELLVPCHPTKDDLSDIRKFCYSSNPKWYRDKGVSLQDVAKNFDKWQSHQEAPKPDKEPSNEHKASSFYTLDAFIERQNQWKTEGVTS